MPELLHSLGEVEDRFDDSALEEREDAVRRQLSMFEIADQQRELLALLSLQLDSSCSEYPAALDSALGGLAPSRVSHERPLRALWATTARLHETASALLPLLEALVYETTTETIVVFEARGWEILAMKAATAALELWSFESPEARGMIHSDDRREAGFVNARVVSQDRLNEHEAAFLLHQPLDNRAPQHPDASITVRFSPDELGTIVLSLRVCAAEFVADFEEFRIVYCSGQEGPPGGRAGLLALATRLEALVQHPTPHEPT